MTARPRAHLLGLLLAAALSVQGCGDDRVQIVGMVGLDVTAPRDGQLVRADTVTVSGTDTPRSAVVLVDGERADRDGDRFTTEVALPEGTKVIDLLAEAPRRRPAVAALRVTRPLTVNVPIVEGLDVGAARKRLEQAGLQADVRESGSIIDSLLGGDRQVCRSVPDAGSTVEVGSEVALDVARHC